MSTPAPEPPAGPQPPTASPGGQKSRKRTAALLIGLLVLAAIIAYTASQFVAFYGHGVKMLRPLVTEQDTVLFDSALKSYKQYRSNAGRWSAVYFGCTFGSALMAAAAGVILKLDSLGKRETLRKDLAAGLAATAALLVTLSTTGNFEAKWRANRLAASGMEALLYEIAKPNPDRTRLLTAMADVNRRLHESVTSGQVVMRPLFPTDSTKTTAAADSQKAGAAAGDTTKRNTTPVPPPSPPAPPPPPAPASPE